MTRFAYMGDRVCLAACAGYVLNRWWLRAALGGAFLRGHFNDLLLIPAALPLALWIQRQLGLRATDAPPNWREIGMHVAAWSMAAELVGPLLFARAVGDPWDVLAYGAGGLIAGMLWQRP